MRTIHDTLAAPGVVSGSDRLDATYRRIDWHLLPFLLLCYVMACLDRYNISFAKLQMQQALGMSEAVYGLGAGIFFIGYMLFEVPGNLLLQRIGARKTISRIMVLWGITSACMLFVHDASSFYVLRFLLGVFEAGFAPGMIFYLTFWYADARRARVTAIVLMGGPLAGLIGGPLAASIMSFTEGARGLAGWQWLFLLEGLPCVLLGVATLRCLADSPAHARWLSDSDRQMLAEAIAATLTNARHRSLGGVLRDPRFYVLAFGYFCLICGVYTVSFWLPTMLRSTGVSGMALGWYAAIPYLSAVVLVPLAARRSDRTGERRLHSALPALLGAVCLLLASTFEQRLAGTLVCMTLATTSIYIAYVVFWSIPTTYMKATAAAGGIALINTIGLFGGFVSPSLIGWIRTITGSLQGGLYLMSALLAIGGLTIFFNRIPSRNKP